MRSHVIDTLVYGTFTILIFIIKNFRLYLLVYNDNYNILNLSQEKLTDHKHEERYLALEELDVGSNRYDNLNYMYNILNRDGNP